MSDNLIPIDYAGKDFEYLRLKVGYKGEIRTKEETPRTLDESDKDTLKLSQYLSNKLPRGGAARIDSYGNLFISGKKDLALDFVPKLIAWENPMKKRWTEKETDAFFDKYL
tara:strand:- start:1091 stop:1423 length:333 start_codon:yes stop_codon:yes gene_type:complete